jgi:signal transduction histidine kinase
VWAVRPGSDTLQSLVDYITHFAGELFEGSPTRCRLDMPHDVPVRALPPDLRHNIFLIVKEALTNVLRHSGASEVHMEVKTTGDMLEILVQDDGKGFNREAMPAETMHGLANMRQRAATIGGTLTTTSAPEKGTTMHLTVKLPD